MVYIKEFIINEGNGTINIIFYVSNNVSSLIVKIGDQSSEANIDGNEGRITIPLTTAINENIRINVDDVDIFSFLFLPNIPKKIVEAVEKDNTDEEKEYMPYSCEGIIYGTIDTPISNNDYSRGLNDGLILGKML